MRRREFIAGIGSAVAWPMGARAQQPVLPVIGLLNFGGRDDSALSAFRQGLREAGFIEGQNVSIEYRWANDQPERVTALAAELVRRPVAVVVVVPNSFGVALVKASTNIIPIVFLSGADPIRSGLVASLNRPGGNLTGVTLISSDLTAKRFGLLHDLAPQVATIAVLLDDRRTAQPSRGFALKEAESAGRNMGLQIIGVEVGSEADFDTAFATAVRDGANGFVVGGSTFFIDHRDRLVALAASHRLPAIYQMREYTEAGGLMSYGPSFADAHRQVGVYTGRVLKGEKPADLPVLQPAKFEFVLNLKTAKALGITIPPGILAIADEVIE